MIPLHVTATDPAALETAPLAPVLAGFLAQVAAQGNPPLESLPPMVAPVPLLLYVHGGGFVIGDLHTHDKVCRTLCHHSGMKVLAVDYRLAPEHPFPAAADDVEAALRWLGAHAAALGGSAHCIAVAGDSAGAQLALVAARRVAPGLAVRAMGLIYPVAQHYSQASASYAENGEGKFLTKGAMQWFTDSYLGGRAEAASHADFALLQAGRLDGLPATWIATMGHDPLRDEGHALALRMAAEGVAVDHRHYPGAIHACIHFTAVSPLGQQVMTDLAKWLRKISGP
jgi:acetyl esterase